MTQSKLSRHLPLLRSSIHPRERVKKTENERFKDGQVHSLSLLLQEFAIQTHGS